MVLKKVKVFSTKPKTIYSKQDLFKFAKSNLSLDIKDIGPEISNAQKLFFAFWYGYIGGELSRKEYGECFTLVENNENNTAIIDEIRSRINNTKDRKRKRTLSEFALDLLDNHLTEVKNFTWFINRFGHLYYKKVLAWEYNGVHCGAVIIVNENLGNVDFKGYLDAEKTTFILVEFKPNDWCDWKSTIKKASIRAAAEQNSAILILYRGCHSGPFTYYTIIGPNKVKEIAAKIEDGIIKFSKNCKGFAGQECIQFHHELNPVMLKNHLRDGGLSSIVVDSKDYFKLKPIKKEELPQE